MLIFALNPHGQNRWGVDFNFSPGKNVNKQLATKRSGTF